MLLPRPPLLPPPSRFRRQRCLQLLVQRKEMLYALSFRGEVCAAIEAIYGAVESGMRSAQIGRHGVWVVEIGEGGVWVVGAGREHRVGVRREAL